LIIRQSFLIILHCDQSQKTGESHQGTQNVKSAASQIYRYPDPISDLETERGSGLGSRSMPEMLQYSTVCSVMQLWLSARAEGLGLGWVSILDPERLSKDLAVPPHWRLIGYFCIGWPSAPHRDPELERAGWERRLPDPVVLER